ncbi:MAG: hypothetical protein WD015_07440, partial [Gaiellaceae bacterium]
GLPAEEPIEPRTLRRMRQLRGVVACNSLLQGEIGRLFDEIRFGKWQRLGVRFRQRLRLGLALDDGPHQLLLPAPLL